MPYSPNLGIIHLDPAQSNKAATVNEELDALDVAIAGAAQVNVAGSANVTLSTTPDGGQAENAVIIFSGAITANIEVIFPNITREWHVVNNTTGAYSLTCIGTSGTGVVIPQNTECDIRWDPVSGNMVQSSSTISGGGGVVTMGGDVTGPSSAATVIQYKGAALPADVGVDFGTAVLTASQTIGFVAVRAHNFASNFAGSEGKAKTASTGTATFTVKKNGTSIGTVVFTSASTATFTTTSGATETLAAGDLLEIVAPSSPDATLAGVRITLFGTR